MATLSNSMSVNPSGFSSLMSLASSEYIDEYVLDEPTASLVSAMSSQSALAMVHREVSCSWQLKLDEETTFSRPIEAGDFLGPMFLVIRAPALVNATQAVTTADGTAGSGNYRGVVPADADRPGELTNGSGPEDYMLKENEFTTAGWSFSSGTTFATEQVAADDFAAYYTDYAPARLIKHARILLNGSMELFKVTCDWIVLVNELYRSSSYKYHETLNHVHPVFSGDAQKADDDEIKRELKVRALAPQTWVVELPFSFGMDVTKAFPRTLLRKSWEDEQGNPITAENTLSLEVACYPLNTIVCNGSNIGTSSTLTAASGAVAVNTVTLNEDRGSNTSTFAKNMNGTLLSKFDTDRFKISVITTEIYVDADTLSTFHDSDKHSMLITQLKQLPTVSSKKTGPLKIDTSSLSSPVLSLYWFTQLNRDTFRNMWYRMRGLIDQVTGRPVKTLKECEIGVGNQVYAHSSSALFDKIMPSKHASQIPRYKDIYMYSFATESPFSASSQQAVPPGSLNFAALKGSAYNDSYIQVWPDAAVFEDNSATDGINAKTGYGPAPSVTVNAMAVVINKLTVDGTEVTLAAP